jgi:hypothetical protein
MIRPAVALLAFALGAFAVPTPADAVEPVPGTGPSPRRVAPPPTEMSVWEAAGESILGDVYATPTRWRELSLSTFFTEGWNEPWASPVPGGGGAPRQGWLNASDGVFYRLIIGTGGYAHDVNDNGDGYTGGVTLYTALSRRLELRTDLPVIASNRGGIDGDRHTAAGDLQLTPRVMLSETQDVSQSFNVTMRIPTGNTENGNGVAAVVPSYEFWAHWWHGLVVRGGAAISVPYNHDGVRDAGARTTFLGNLSAGYYFTPHDMTPVGDLVWYVATNLAQATDDRGPSTTTVTFTPGFRTHMGCDWYALGGVEIPATNPEPFDYQVLAGLMKVF